MHCYRLAIPPRIIGFFSKGVDLLDSPYSRLHLGGLA